MGQLGVYVTRTSRRKMRVQYRFNNLKGRCHFEGGNILTWPLSDDKDLWQALEHMEMKLWVPQNVENLSGKDISSF
jgi:hypothetical protein